MTRVVFMGTPEFAVPSLRALAESGYEVVGVFTQPDRPAGRGKKLVACPVKLCAQSQGLPVLQVEKIRRPEGLEALRALAPDLCVTAAFGQILSRDNLAVPKLGTVNVHASLLPKYRGPAPINACIIDGETETGVTTMFTDVGVDTGDILLQERTPIGAQETAGALTGRLSEMGAALLIKTLRAIEGGTCPRTPQDESLATRCAMLTKDSGHLDFTRSAQTLARLARGVNPWPGAWTTLPDGGVLKVWSARAVEDAQNAAPGTVVLSDPKQGLVVACGEGALEILEMQAPGTKRMEAKAYLRGRPIAAGTVLHG